MFSTITMALSTSMPSARISEKSTIMFRVMPSTRSTMKVISIEKGMAAPTKSELVKPRKNSSTATTRIRPLMMLFSSSPTMLRMSVDWSPTIVTATPAGIRSARSTSRRFTSSTISMTFSPLRFFTERITASWPLTREIVSRSLTPSATVATSRR